MRALALFAVASVLALAGCAKNDDKVPKTGGAEPVSADAANAVDQVSAPAGFPKMTASYAGVYTINEGPNGGPQTITMEISGWKKLRSEMPHFNQTRAAAGQKLVMILDETQNRSLAFVEGPDAPNIAVVMPVAESVFQDFRSWGAESGKAPKKIGSDTVAGVKCDIWEAAIGDDGSAPDHACIAAGGIFLWSKEAGAAEPAIVATSIDKGPIADSRFATPKDAEIVDMGPCMTLAQEAIVAAQAGKTPDLAKMQQCQAVGQKVSAVMGG